LQVSSIFIATLLPSFSIALAGRLHIQKNEYQNFSIFSINVLGLADFINFS